MKGLIRKSKLILSVLVLIIAFSCTGEDGEDGVIGPQGVSGADGPQGTQGETGDSGVDGEDGNANIISSDWFGPLNQYSITNGYTAYAEFELDIPELDAEIYDKGTLLVYAKFSNFVSEIWPTDNTALLPITISGGTTEHFFTYYYSSSTLKIRYRRDPTNASTTFSTSNRFRYILIPASTLSSKNTMDYAKMSYEEVMDHFGLNH